MALQGFSACSNKPRLNFSIESILKRKEGNAASGGSTIAFAVPETTSCPYTPGQTRAGHLEGTKQTTNLPWLRYTRYHPPRIQRSRHKFENCKRKTSGRPRVPFSTSQFIALERKYNQSRYVSSSEVSQLSANLSLPEHRVKIWFQNRRAREKKANFEKGGLANTPIVGPPHFASDQPQYPHITTANWPMNLPPKLTKVVCSSTTGSAASLRLSGSSHGIFYNTNKYSWLFADLPPQCCYHNFGHVTER